LWERPRARGSAVVALLRIPCRPASKCPSRSNQVLFQSPISDRKIHRELSSHDNQPLRGEWPGLLQSFYRLLSPVLFSYALLSTISSKGAVGGHSDPVSKFECPPTVEHSA